MSEAKLVQCLCPKRHCVIAIACKGVDDDLAQKEMRAYLALSIGGGLLNPWCGLCGAKMETWKCEVSPLPGDWEAAIQKLLKSEADQLKTREYMQRIGAAFDKPTPMGSRN